MFESKLTAPRLEAEPLPEDIPSIQPGGGLGLRVDLAWGRLRRVWLRAFRSGYVRKMRGLRRGDCPDCPHDIIDPRDLKPFRNVCGYWFDPADDPFRWRRRLPIARWAWPEIWLLGLPLAVAAAISAVSFWQMAPVFATLLVLVVAFFRDPPRRVPNGLGLVVSPADGRITDVTEVDQEEFVGGPAVRIGIFLSIFSVHGNRVPVQGRVISLRYRRGRFRNAMRSASARENEQMAIAMEADDGSGRRVLMRQIAGAIARRIVCELKPGERVQRGQRLGMIKFGSRTELVLPREKGLEVLVSPGKYVKGGKSVLARYREESRK